MTLSVAYLLKVFCVYVVFCFDFWFLVFMTVILAFKCAWYCLYSVVGIIIVPFVCGYWNYYDTVCMWTIIFLNGITWMLTLKFVWYHLHCDIDICMTLFLCRLWRFFIELSVYQPWHSYGYVFFGVCFFTLTLTFSWNRSYIDTKVCMVPFLCWHWRSHGTVCISTLKCVWYRFYADIGVLIGTVCISTLKCVWYRFLCWHWRSHGTVCISTLKCVWYSFYADISVFIYL